MKSKKKIEVFPIVNGFNIYYLKFTDYHPDVESIS